MIEIDGSRGEGGGQILRSALALSMCTGQAFTLTRIRAGRAKPGLMRQHLSCVNAAAEISSAQVEGAELNSQALQFTPGAVRAGSYAFNVGSAGSCTLVLQTVWPALMLAAGESRVQLKGGTHNPMAPPFHFLERSYAPLLRRLGAPVQLTLQRHGFYPAGGGEFEAVIGGAREALTPFDLNERGGTLEEYADCLAPALPSSIARRELNKLASLMGWPPEQLRNAGVRQNEGPGNALLATLAHQHVTEVFTEFGEKGVTAEAVATRLAQELRRYKSNDGALGPHLADQWVLPLALAVHLRRQPASYSCTELTPHALSNFEVVQRFLPVGIRTRPLGKGQQVQLTPA
ncbi:RNA 3'-terminal phosphate cyclase [Comamonas guangdongensis]|uniref:RNA 3'-terminal phosphate cyclase n=1 Tax=Comamonas guangdongensis TaxID=510515 RepID=A0ABV3ZVS9_9BURK